MRGWIFVGYRTPRFGNISSMSRKLLFSLLIATFILPYLVPLHYQPIPSFDGEWLAAGLWFLIVLCLVLLPRLAPAEPLPKIAALPAALFLLLLLQMMVLPMDNPTAIRLCLGYVAFATLLTYAGYRLRNLAGLTCVLAWACVAGAMLSCAIEVIQICYPPSSAGPAFFWGHLIEARTGGRLGANLRQVNHLATYLSWGLAGVFYLYQRAILKWCAAGILAWVILCGMALTGSHTAWVHLTLIGILFSVAHWHESAVRRAGGASRRQAVVGAGIRLGLLWLAYALVDLLRLALNHWFGFGLGGDGADGARSNSLNDRIQLWNYGWHMFTAHPWFGVGWGDFPAWQYRYLETLGPVTIASSAHDIFLDFLAQTGVIGCAVLVVGLTAWAWRAGRRDWTLQRVFLLSLVGTLLAHSLVEYPLNYTYFLFPFAFALGALDTAPLRISGVRLPVYVSALVLPVICVSMLLLASDMQKLTRFWGTRPIAGGLQSYSANQARLLWIYGLFAVAEEFPVNPAQLEMRLKMQQTALAVAPMPGVIINYAIALALLGRDDEALHQVARMKLAVSPPWSYPQAYAILLVRAEEQGSRLTDFTAKLFAMRPASIASVSTMAPHTQKPPRLPPANAVNTGR